jgi:hypothetical protein
MVCFLLGSFCDYKQGDMCSETSIEFQQTTRRYLSEDKTSWPESASELYRPSDRRLSVKLVPAFADTECHVARVTDPHCRKLGLLYRSHNFFFQVAPQLYSRG